MNTEEIKEQETVDQEFVDQKTDTSHKETKKSSGKQNKAKVAELEEELELTKDKYIRLYAEFDNYKKRTVKERLDLMSTASKEVILALLPVVDDFDRAKKMADDENSSEVFTAGVSLVYQKFKGLLTTRGVKEMDTNGAEFNPEMHEAITEIPVPNEELKGKIIDTIEKGYLIHDKIIRHAKVVVGK